MASERKPTSTVHGTADDILAFLDRYGTRDKDAAISGASPKPVRQTIEKGKGGTRRITLDLHGLVADEAVIRLRGAFDNCRHHGVRELLVVHGQGHHTKLPDGPVLKTLVRSMLDNELRLQVGSFRPGLPREGGDGSTLVILR